MNLKEELLAVIRRCASGRRETYDLEGVPVDVVDRGGLIAMKRIAGRPQDLGDIAGLEGR